MLDASDNQLAGTLSDFAFQAAANRADLHSALRYFDVSNNSLAGEPLVAFGIIMDDADPQAQRDQRGWDIFQQMQACSPGSEVCGFSGRLQDFCKSIAALFMG